MISAYLDPASGSAIISAVVAGTAGAGVAARTMMAKMRLKKQTTQLPAADTNDTEDIDFSDDPEAAAAETVDEPTQ